MGDKSASGAKTYNYYGTLLAAVCTGPVDQLHAVLVDGKSIVDCDPPLTRGAGPDTDITSLVEDKYLKGGGRMVIYWGTDTQDISVSFPALAHHPDYRGVCLLAASGMLFGRERTTAPNLEVIVTRKPVADTSLVDAVDNPIEDGQVNPVAALVECLVGWQGLGLAVGALEAADWLAAAAFAAADPDRYFCSPLLAEQVDARRGIPSLLEMIEAALYWTPEGKLGIRLIQPGVNPGSLGTLDAAHLTERPRLDGAGWPDVPTSVVVRHPDRDASYKQREARLANLLALRSRGLPKTMAVERPHVTRADQAARIAAELIRRTARPAGRIDLTVRRYHADGLGPGSKVLVDVDPEPGGAGSAQMCVVQDRRDSAGGPVRLSLLPDTLVDATPYSPQFTAPDPQAAECPGIVAADSLAIPLAPAVWGTGRVAVLAPRPGAAVVGFRLFFAVDTDEDGNLDEETWADLGVQPGFAVQMTLAEDVDEDETAIDLTLTAGADGVDAYLAGRLPDNARDAEQDPLLLVLANLDGSDRVAISGGQPECEICSVVSRSAVDADTHSYTVLRARRGTPARVWPTSGAPRAYLIPLSNLVAWTHPQLAGVSAAGLVGYLRMVAYTAETEDAGARPQISFTFPAGYSPWPSIAWTAPSDGSPDYGQGMADPTTGSYTPNVEVLDADGDLLSVEITSRLSDGSGYVARHAVTLSPAGSYAFSSALTFASGSHVLTVTAMDKAGNVASSSRTVARTAVGGLAPPVFDPAGETEFRDNLAITITVASPADQVQWVVASPGSAEPTSWPNTTTAGDLDRVVTLTSSKRVWARARKSSDGSTGSATYADYSKITGD
jgi:hypothetical protein